MKALALLVLTSTGCLVVTRTTTTTTKVGVEKSDAVPAKLDQLTLAASTSEHTLVVHAVASGTCSREVSNVFEVRESKHLAMGGADDPRAKVFGLLVSPITLPVSGLVSSVSLLGGDKLTRVIKLDHKELAACTRPADHIALAIELASGAKDTAHVDDHGDLAYAIPLSEPYDGTITVRSGAASREVTYHQNKPAYVAARDALQTCGAGAATLALQVNDHGGAQLAWVAGADTSVAECVRTHLAQVVFPVRDETIELPFGLEHVVDTAQRIKPVCAHVAGGELQEKTLARVLEEEDLLVSNETCEEIYTGSVERTGTAFTVHLRNAAGARHTIVPTVADIPAAYRQLVHLLAAKDSDERGSEARVPQATDSEPQAVADAEQHDEAPAPASEESSGSRSLLYARVGFGSVTALGAGYRYTSGHAGLDVSAAVAGSSSISTGTMKGEVLVVASPAATSSWYAGFGTSLGGMQYNTYAMSASGGGIGVEMTAGYEFPIATARAFLQSDLTIPAYSFTDAVGNAIKAPTTFVVSLGVGAPR